MCTLAELSSSPVVVVLVRLIRFMIPVCFLKNLIRFYECFGMVAETFNKYHRMQFEQLSASVRVVCCCCRRHTRTRTHALTHTRTHAHTHTEQQAAAGTRRRFSAGWVRVRWVFHREVFRLSVSVSGGLGLGRGCGAFTTCGVQDG